MEAHHNNNPETVHNFLNPEQNPARMDDKKWGTLPRAGKSPVNHNDYEFSGQKQRPNLKQVLFSNESHQDEQEEEERLPPIESQPQRRNSTPVPNVFDNGQPSQSLNHQPRAHTIGNPSSSSSSSSHEATHSKNHTLTPIKNPEEFVQLSESTAIQAYKSRMDSLLRQSYFGYVDLRNYHDELVASITYALTQTVLNNYSYYNDNNVEEGSSSSSNEVEEICHTILTNLERLFRSQFSVYLNKNEVKIESWVKQVKAATTTALIIFETTVRTGLETALASGSFQPDYLFQNLEDEGRWKALENFGQNCTSKNNELIERICEKTEDLKEEYRAQLNNFISNHHPQNNNQRQQPDSPKTKIISPVPQQEQKLVEDKEEPKIIDSQHHPHHQQQQWAEQDGETVKRAAVAQNESKQIDHQKKYHEKTRGQLLQDEEVKAIQQQVPIMASAVVSKSSTVPPSSKLIFYLSFTSTWVRRLDFNTSSESSTSRRKSLQNFPPYIYYSPKAILIGHDAQQGKDRSGYFNITKILRDIHIRLNLVVNSVQLTSEEIIAQYLELVSAEMTKSDKNPTPITEYIIIHPACLTTFQKRRLKMAADLAGFYGKNSLVPLYRSVADFLVSNWTLPDQPHPVLIVHYTANCFDVVVATYSKTEMRILSYAGAESVENPQNFLHLHTKMIQTILTHQSSPNLKEPTLTYYYEIICRSLEAASILYDNLQNVYVIFETNTTPIKTVLQKVIPRKSIIELDENKLFAEPFFQQFERWPTTPHQFATSDVYPRNFGFIVNKKIHRYILKKNEPLPSQKIISKFTFPSVKGLNELTLGERMEKETYRFQTNGPDDGVSVHVTTTPEGLYDVKLRSDTHGSSPIPLDNTTFPYLANLKDKIAHL